MGQLALVIWAAILPWQASTPDPGCGPAALADGRRCLIQQVLNASLPEGRTVRESLAGSAAAEVELRRLVVRKARVLRSRAEDGGPGRVTLMLDLGTSGVSSPPAASPSPLIRLREDLGGRTFVAVGLVTAGAPGPSPPSPQPAGWENVSPAGLTLAAAAARDAACRALLSQFRTRYAPPTDAFAALLQDSAACARWSALQQVVQFDSPVFDAAQICVVRARAEQAALGRAWATLTAGQSGADTALPPPPTSTGPGITDEMLEAEGFGLPPLQETLGEDARGPGEPEPEWARQTLSAAGRGAVPAGPGGKEAIRSASEAAARADARIKLARQVDALRLPDGTSVGAFIRAHPQGNGVWSAILQSAHITALTWQDGVCAATAELPLDSLWDVIATERAMR